MHKDDTVCQVIRGTAKKLPQIIRQDDVWLSTDEGDPRELLYITGHQGELITTGEEYSIRNTHQRNHAIMPRQRL